jgi:hypothetical protein
MLQKNLKSEPKQVTFNSKLLESSDSQLAADLSAKSRIKSMHNFENNGIMNYLYNIAKPPVDNIISIIGSKSETNNYDEESIYEDTNSVTKTLFRSDSFDDLVDESIFSSEQNTRSAKSLNSIYGFYLEDFSNTFNLKDLDDDQVLEEAEFSTGQLEPLDSMNQNILFDAEENVNDNSFYPSVSSAESISFNDVSMRDILSDCDLKTVENKDSLNEIGLKLNKDETELVDAVVIKLTKQLQPVLEQFEKDSQKYEIMKSLYKLPSISNLNEELKNKYAEKSKKFKLEFHHDVISEMISKESEKYKIKSMNKKKSICPIISADDQVRLNFNKYRELDTIKEEKSFELNGEQSCKKVKSSEPNYNRFEDSRKVEELETDELINLLKLIKYEKLKDFNNVKHLVSMFEFDENCNAIKKLSNTQLKNTILSELNQRKII